MTSNNIEMYTSWRDDFLKIISQKFCKDCTDSRKNEVLINHEDPLNCECRCHRVENIFTTVSNIDSEIQLLKSAN